jgi:hypothetical protein
MKKVLSFIIIFTMAAALLPLTASALTNSSTGHITASPNSTFTFNLIIGTGDVILNSLDFGQLILIDGRTDIIGEEIPAGGYSFRLRAPNTGEFYIVYEVTSGTTARRFTTVVSIPAPSEPAAPDVPLQHITPVLENVRVIPGEVVRGEAFTVHADIFNYGAVIKDAEIIAADSAGNRLARRFIGDLGQSPTGAEYVLEIPSGLDVTGTRRVTITLTYRDGIGRLQSISQSTTIRVNRIENIPLEILSVDTPSVIETGAPVEISFSLVNRGNADFRNAQAFIFMNNTQVASMFIGQIATNSGTNHTINHTFTSDTAAYELRVSYENTAGVKHEARQRFNPSFSAVTAGEDSGVLRIQSVSPPADVLVRSNTSVEFWLTNPTAASVKGAEAFLLDAAGNEITSVYMSEIAGNSTTQQSLTFAAASTAGSTSYSIKVTYRDNSGVLRSLHRQFTVITVSELTDTGTGRPGNVIIQRIDNPGAMYTNVDTSIPFTLVNAGRGVAHHVQVYVTDAQGNELTREYIGTLADAQRHEDRIRLKFDEVGERELTLHVSFESADESRGAAQRGFTQRVTDYRASVTDIAGYEWGLWQGEPANIEFSVLNSGTETLLNVTAYLVDSMGMQYSEVFIGTIEPGTKKERQRFRNVMFWEAAWVELTIKVVYENADMKEFSFTESFGAMVNEMWSGGWDDGMVWDGGWEESDETDAEGGGMAWWIWVLIGVGVAVPGIIVLTYFLRKSARKRENAEMENFIRMMAASGNAPAEPATTASAYPTFQGNIVDNEGTQ